jgi:hypothetical protein
VPKAGEANRIVFDSVRSELIEMAGSSHTFYVAPEPEIAVVALLQVLELFDANIVKSLPPVELKAAYIVVNFGKRARLAQENSMESWYGIRSELDVPGTLIGLTLKDDNDPVSGAYQIPMAQVIPELIGLFRGTPRALAEAEVKRQKQPVEKRQTQIIVHDLQQVLNGPALSARIAWRRLTRTLKLITVPQLHAELNDLLVKLEKGSEGPALRELLTGSLTRWRQRYE